MITALAIGQARATVEAIHIPLPLSGRAIAYEVKVPHFVRDDTVCLMGALRKSQQNCHPERSEGPFVFFKKPTPMAF
jgi:hypothetical protein